MSRFGKKSGIIHEDIDKELVIDPENLNNELLDQPLIMRKWCSMESEAAYALTELHRNLEYKEAILRLEYAKKGMRVAEVEASIVVTPEIQDLKQKINETEKTHNKLKHFVKCLYQRHEALKDLCANARKDMMN